MPSETACFLFILREQRQCLGTTGKSPWEANVIFPQHMQNESPLYKEKNLGRKHLVGFVGPINYWGCSWILSKLTYSIWKLKISVPQKNRTRKLHVKRVHFAKFLKMRLVTSVYRLEWFHYI